MKWYFILQQIYETRTWDVCSILWFAFYYKTEEMSRILAIQQWSILFYSPLFAGIYILSKNE